MTRFHLGMKLSTPDQDNDELTSSSCAVTCKGAWWYGNLSRCQPEWSLPERLPRDIIYRREHCSLEGPTLLAEIH